MAELYSYRDLGFDEYLNRGYSPDASSFDASGAKGNSGFDFFGAGESYDASTLPNLVSSTTQPGTIGSADAGGRISFVPNGYLQSSNFVTGSAGWRIDGEGNAEFNEGTFRGALIANSIDIPDQISANSFHVDNQGNTWWGANAAAAPTSAPAYVLNTGVAAFTNVTVNGSTLSSEPIYGSGVDGDVTVAVSAGLTRDMFYNNLTINAGIILTTNGFRIFVRNNLAGTGIIDYSSPNDAGRNGGNATDAVGGAAGVASAALASGTIAGAVAGASGSVGPSGAINASGGNSPAGGAGNNTAKGIGSNGVAGRVGGTGGIDGGGLNVGGIGGAAGTAGVRTGTVFNLPYSVFSAYQMIDWYPGLAIAALNSSAGTGGSSGGGSGASRDINSHGGGGGGGGASGGAAGLVSVFARIITGALTIRSNGGLGGNGGNGGNATDLGGGAGAGGGGGGASGSGGSGGVVVVVYNNNVGGAVFQANGGTGGTPGTGGNLFGTGANGAVGQTGLSGNGGVVIELQN